MTGVFRRFAACIGFGCVVAAFGSSWAAISAASVKLPANQLQGVRLEAQPESTRVTVELAADSQPRFFELDRPRRAVLDFPATRLRAGVALPAPGGAVVALRTGPQANGDLRVVIELAPQAIVRWTPSRAPARRFELAIVGAPVPAAAPAPMSTSGAAVPASTATLSPIKTEHAPPAEGRDVIVAIDAGHGGQDPGAIGRGGTREKDVVLDIARELAERINREPGMRAILTRDGDYFLTLRQRIRRARDAGAQLFVSVHADSVRDPAVSGSSVYVLSLKGATDEQARLLADRENAADLAGGVSLEDKDPVIASVLVDLAQSAQISQSMVAAERVLRSMARVNDVRKPQVQQAGFVVLKSPDIPSMLVETAFISSPADERLLGKAERREALAEAIFDGVKQYFIDHPPDGSRFALARAEQRKVVAASDEAVGATAGKL